MGGEGREAGGTGKGTVCGDGERTIAERRSLNRRGLVTALASSTQLSPSICWGGGVAHDDTLGFPVDSGRVQLGFPVRVSC